MKKNLELTNGIFFSQRVLLELTTVWFYERRVIQNSSKKCYESMERKFFIL